MPLNANEWPNPCYQIPILPHFINNNFSEDCLYLNIWSPHVKSDKNELRPVMVFIHGGALIIGSSVQDLYNGQELSSRGDVVVVTLNYRLDVFGFLYTDTDEAPGNQGLWDQALALEWVNNNIEKFGGDPNQTTIFGHSAGSWSVSLHLLSPITRDLYQNAIMMSGAALNHISDKEPENIKNAWLRGAIGIGCAEDEDSSYVDFTPNIMECLRDLDPETILRIPTIEELSIPKLGWFRLVVIDGKFLPKEPIDMLKSGDYKKNTNLLIGTTENEGSVLLSLFYDPNKYDFINPKEFTLDEAIDELDYLSSNFASNLPIDGEEVSNLYFNGFSDETDSEIIRSQIGIALGDFYITCPTIRFAELLYSYDRNDSNVYQYYYSNRLGESSCGENIACHGSDLNPVFGTPLRISSSSSFRQKYISEQMIGIFSHFAKHGYPEPQNDIEYPSYYTLDDFVMKPYYEISVKPKPITNFGLGLKVIECEYLWKKYLDN